MAGDVPADERILITPEEDTDGEARERSEESPTGTPEDAGSDGGITMADRVDGVDRPAWYRQMRTGDDPAGGTDAVARSTARDELVAAAAAAGERPLHRYGRVRVVGRPVATALVTGEPDIQADTTPDVPPIHTPVDGTIVATTGLSPGLDLTESYGVDAFRLRAGADYRRRKGERPRDNAPWDMNQPCTDIPLPRGSGSVSSPLAPTIRSTFNGLAAESDRDAPTPTPVPVPSTTSALLEGSVAVGLILVEGPTPALQLSAAERTKIIAEVQNGLSWYATRNPAAELTFSYDIQIVRLTVPANPAAGDLESYWRNATMSRLGYAATFDGVYDYVDDIRARLGTRWAYCAFFTKYPLGHFAYASIGGPRVVMAADNDGWGPDNIDRVFAHETGHIFGAPDEYSSSGCDCQGSWGRFGTPNGNCDGCTPNAAPCLMLANSFDFCRYTPSHVGWGRGVGGNPVLIQSRGLGQRGNFELVVPSAFAGITHLWRDNDVSGSPWRSPWQTAQALGPVDAVSMVQSSLATVGPLEVVTRTGSDLYFLWRDSTGAFAWRTPTRIAQGVGGVPSLIQSRLGGKGNFELLAPAAGNGILHLWRNHDVYGYPWSTPRLFGANLGKVEAVSLIHGTLGGGAGMLEAVARVGNRLVHLSRDNQAVWRTNGVFAEGVAGSPALIQSTFPGARNFEVVVPSAGDGLIHYYRNNNLANPTWSGPRLLGATLGRVDAVSMIQSNYGGNLEVVARVGDRLHHMWRSSTNVWSVPRRIF